MKLNILIVDDDADLGKFMRLRLSMEAPHFSIALVERGQECLEHLKTNPVDCIISDYQMPEMNGMELLLALRTAGSDIPVIFVTGQGNEEVAREAFKNGAYDYFTKDFGFAHFARIINSVEQAVAQRTAEAERKRAEDALRASQKYLQTIIETEPECVKLISLDGKLLMMNRAGLAMIEADSLEQVRGKSVYGLIVPEHREPFKALGETVSLGGAGTLEFDMVGFKGKRRRLETHAVPLRNEKDEIIALLGITRDITERKLAAEALEESRSAYQALAENLPGIVYRIFIRENGRMRFLNRAAESIIGYTDEELQGGEVCRLETMILPEDLDAVIAEVKRAVSEKRPFMVEYRLRRKDGGIRFMLEQGTPIYGPDKKPLYIDGVIFDVTERKLAEDAQRLADENVRNSLAILRAALESTADGILIVDNEGRVKSFNDKFLRMWNIPVSISVSMDDNVLLGHVLDQLKEPQQFLDKVQKIYSSPDAEILDTLEFKDGRIFERYSQPQRIDGVTVGRVWSFRDITKRKQVEDELRSSQALLQAIVEGTPDAVYVKDLQGRYLLFNRGASKFTGKASEDVLGNDDTALFPLGDARTIMDGDSRVMKSGITSTYEEYLTTASGEKVHFLSTKGPLFDNNGNITGLFGIARDITERKRAEAALMASQKYLETIFDTEPECVKLLASDGTLVMMNRAGLAMIEADSLEQVKGASVVDLVVPEHREAFKALGEKVFQGGSGTLEFDMVGLKGGRLRLETHAVPLRNENDEIIALLGITRNISERKNLERQRTDFHAMVTHDLKSPLAAILGYSELISKAAQSAAVGDIEEMAQAIKRSGEKMLRVVDDFMSAARIESGGVELRTTPTDVAGMLLDVRDDFEPIARKKGIAFSADIPDGLPLAALDKKQVERAVGNLLQNAFNYTRKGGWVKLLAEAVSHQGGKYILVSVSDTGQGISPEDMDKIFDKYYRSPKTAGTKGTGLGLAIVKAIAEAHGGMVEVESEEGKGSTFRLYLPIDNPDLSAKDLY